MSDPNRASYAPERPLAFDDYRQPRRGGPAPVTLILSLLVLMAAAGGVFFLYRGGLRPAGGPPQPVGAPVTDVRIAAPPQPAPPDPSAGLSIYKDDPNAAGAPSFTPPPEQPAPRPVAAAPTTPVASAALKPATPTSAMAAPAPAKTPEKPATIDKLLADANSPAPTAASNPPSTTVASAKSAQTPTKPGGFSVQIGAFSSEALADKSWNQAAGVAPGAMAGKNKHVAPMTKDDGSTLYRASITGFTNHDDAVALCDKLRAAGQTCFVR
jgi:cell division protein FtsN